jgi:hypothetical protein
LLAKLLIKRNGERMKRTQHYLKTVVAFSLLIGLALWSTFGRRAGAQQDSRLTAAQAEQLFTEKIRPVLEAKCRSCHDRDGAMSDLDLSSRAALLKGGKRGAAVLPGDAARSLLFIAITGADEKLVKRMPLGGKALGDDVIMAFRQWIDAGAPWPETNAATNKTWTYKEQDVWAFRARPQVTPPLGSGSPVDAFLMKQINAKQLTPAPAADRTALLRRATFDLHGLPPTPEEVAAFVQDKDALPQAFAKVVERLLASPHYGERWGRHWLDVVRYADTGGGANDYERPHAWRYRDYVIRAFNNDKPYDQFIREQIAGDELDANNPEHLIATGFLRMGPWEHTGMSVEAVTRQEWLDDVTHATGTAFLGLTMGCAKCHDHKFDPIPAKDYYRLQAVFATTSFADRTAPFLAQENLLGKEQATARLTPKLNRALAKQAEVANALGIKLRTQAPNQSAASPVATAPSAPPPLVTATPPAQQPPGAIKRYGADAQKAELREFERAYLKRVEFGKLALKRYEPLAYSVSNGDPAKPQPSAETFVLIGGNLTSPGEKVAPGVPSAPCQLAQQAAPQLPTQVVGRRLALADWIARGEHPLTARVMVNRIWQWHFGKGLVATANNFGKLGARPTHPELLDWLAHRFVAAGWSVKAMHRLLMNSDAYRRAAAHPQIEIVQKADPDNQLLAYFPARRLEAEELRDAILMVSGELNESAGGPPIFPEINADLIRQPRLIMGTVAPAWEPSPTRAQRNRRTIYTFQQRSLLNPLVEVFNGANPNESCEFRRASTIAPQVFNLFNSQFSHDAALAMAQRLEVATNNRAAQIALAFRLALQRVPTAAEQRLVLAHLAAMTAHHEKTAPPPLSPLQPVEQLINSEFTGQTIRFIEDTDFSGYERNLHPSQVSASTRALAELCLTLLNANEFVYVY